MTRNRDNVPVIWHSFTNAPTGVSLWTFALFDK